MALRTRDWVFLWVTTLGPLTLFLCLGNVMIGLLVQALLQGSYVYGIWTALKFVEEEGREET